MSGFAKFLWCMSYELAIQGAVWYWLVLVKKEEKAFSEQKSRRRHEVNSK